MLMTKIRVIALICTRTERGEGELCNTNNDMCA